MSIDEAIRTLYELGDALELSKDSKAWKAMDMAIKALQSECTFVNKEVRKNDE